MKFLSTTGAVLLSLTASLVHAIDFKADDEASIKNVCRTYAYGLMSEYKNNATGTAEQDIGIFPKPHYWWAAGAAWGGMIEYTQLTGDESHVKTLQQALVSNYGPDKNFLLPWRKDQTGNDDQAFWALAVMSALESKFPEPENAPATYLEVATNAFNNIVSRWDETSCGGGLKWQIYPENAYGYNYKNSISNGGAFALGARLARYTGNTTYSDWAEKFYEWTKSVGLLGDDWQVFDGTDDKEGCAKINDKTEWSYNNAMYLHGAAFMYDLKNGDKAWKERISGLLTRNKVFFGATDNTKEIMFEPACETGEHGRSCNLDQQSFKAYLARWMAQTAVLAPFTKDEITKYLKASAIGAAKSCSGGDDKVTCGSKWYTGSWDNTRGVGQQLSALEVTQSLLTIKNNVVPAKTGEQQQEKPKDDNSEEKKPKEKPEEEKPKEEKPKEEKPEEEKPEEQKPEEEKPKEKPEEQKPEAPAPTPAPEPAPEQCTCTPTTVTVYVPPTTDAPAPPPSPPTPPTEQPPPYNNGTVPVPPPGNGTNGTTPPPEEFQGAASSFQVTLTSILSAAALAVLVGLL